MTNFYPSITEVVPPAYPDLRQEFGKLESLMWNARKPKVAPTATLPEANDRYELFDVFSQDSGILVCQLEYNVVHYSPPYCRIHTVGWNYTPVHTEIYGSYRSQAARGGL